MEQRYIQRKTPFYKLPIYPEHFQLAACDTIILFQMSVLTFGNLVLEASNLTNLIHWIEYYQILRYTICIKNTEFSWQFHDIYHGFV